MKVGAHVRLTKVSETNPGAYALGYWLEGQIANEPGIEVGTPIIVWRHCRAAREPGEVSPVMLDGFYHSSPVVSINPETGDVVTENSVWRVSAALIPIPLDTDTGAV